MAVPPKSAPMPGTSKPLMNATVRANRVFVLTVTVQRAPAFKSRRQFI